MSQYHHKNKTGFLNTVWQYKLLLLVYILAISGATFAILYIGGSVPGELISAGTSPTTSTSGTTTLPGASMEEPRAVVGQEPVRVVIAKIGVNAVIYNPESADNNTLNYYVDKGAVRYPGSGLLGAGNVFLFGHSTGIRVVNNQAYKTFNHLKDLKAGDEIEVYSSDKIYVYTVTTNKMMSSDKVLVDFSTTKNMITLSTCNVFGQKEDRYVVEALFSSTKPISTPNNT